MTDRISKRSAARACVLFLLAFFFYNASFAADGDLDTAFGTAGRVMTDVGGRDDQGRAVLVQADGKIVVAGYSGDYPEPIHSTLVRYYADGTLDETFGAGGKTVVALGAESDVLNSLVQQPDGKIVAGGFLYDYPYKIGFIVARFDTSGLLDPTFAGTGYLIFDYGDINSETNAVLLQPDGKIVVIGMTGMGGLTDFAVVRLNANGTFDKRFGRRGMVRTHFEGSFGTGSKAFAAALQPDGKIVAAGEYHFDYNHQGFGLARYNADGTLDMTFGVGGTASAATTPTMPHLYAFAHSVLLQPDGSIVAAGYQHTGNHNNDFALMRFTSNGNLDETFGNGGRVITDMVNASDDIGYSLARQRNGKLILAGRTGQYPNFRFGVVRYNLDGSVDGTFGVDGRVLTDFNNVASQSFAVAMQPDGKAVVAGYSITGTTGENFNANFALARYDIRGVRGF